MKILIVDWNVISGKTVAIGKVVNFPRVAGTQN